MRKATSIFRLLPIQLQKKGAQRGQLAVSLVSAWNRIMDTAIIRHSRPVSLENGVLRIAADSPLWASRLRHTPILEQLKQHEVFTHVESVKIVVSQADAADTNIKVGSKTDSVDRKISKRASQIIAGAADSVDDEDLKAALRRLSDHTAANKTDET